MTQPALTLRAMKRFRCIGADCEDTCCAGWRVLLQEQDAKTLIQIRTKQSSANDTKALDDCIVWPKTKDNGQPEPGYIKLQSNDDCSFLDQQGWCELQSKHGEQALPIVCSMYPRMMRQTEYQIEMGGLISCPEYARKLLLVDDAATIEEFHKHETPREVAFDISLDANTLYEANLHPVRALMISILQHNEGTPEQKLFTLAFFAHSTKDFFLQNDEGIDVQAAKTTLEEKINRFCDLSFLSALAQGYDEQQLPQQLILPVIQGIFEAALANKTTASFRKVITDVHESYLDNAKLDDQATAGIWKQYCDRKQNVLSVAHQKLQRATLNRAINYIFSTWYLKDADLMQYIQRLLLEMATSRFLFFSHPRLLDLDQQSEEQRSDTIDEVLVNVFSSTARSLGHDGRFRHALDAILTNAKMRSLAGCTFLLRL